jgi:WD40 repeat protein
MWDVAFAPDGKSLVSSEGRGNVWLWSLPASAEHPQQLDLPEGTLGEVISVDASRLVTLHSDGTARFFDAVTLEELHHFSLMIPEIHCGAAGPRAEFVATGGADGSLRLWQLENGKVKVVAQNMSPGKRIWTLAFDVTGTRLAAADEYGSIKLYEVPSLKKVGEWPFTGRGRAGLSFSKKGRWLVFASNEGAVGYTTLIDLGKSGMRREYSGTPVDSYVFTADEGTLVAVKNDGMMEIRSVPDGPLRTVVNSQVLHLSSVTLGPGEQRILAGSKDGTLVIWDMATLHEVGSFHRGDEPIEELTFLPDGQTLATLSRKTLLQWPAPPASKEGVVRSKPSF